MKNNKTTGVPSTTKKSRSAALHDLVTTAMLAAVASVLMFLSFNVPLMPQFIKLDFSELPALLASFALGPIYGVAVCLIKNLINLLFSTTGGIGELANFLIGVLFVLPAGYIYRANRSRKNALIGSAIGAISMAVLSVFINYYIVYPVYTVFLPMETILSLYQVINPKVQTLWDALLWFNMPFTFIKGMISVGIAFLIYKPISPILKGTRKSK